MKTKVYYHWEGTEAELQQLMWEGKIRVAVPRDTA